VHAKCFHIGDQSIIYSEFIRWKNLYEIYWLTNVSDRSFPVAGLWTWNDFQETIRAALSLSQLNDSSTLYLFIFVYLLVVIPRVLSFLPKLVI